MDRAVWIMVVGHGAPYSGDRPGQFRQGLGPVYGGRTCSEVRGLKGPPAGGAGAWRADQHPLLRLILRIPDLDQTRVFTGHRSRVEGQPNGIVRQLVDGDGADGRCRHLFGALPHFKLEGRDELDG